MEDSRAHTLDSTSVDRLPAACQLSWYRHSICITQGLHQCGQTAGLSSLCPPSRTTFSMPSSSQPDPRETRIYIKPYCISSASSRPERCRACRTIISVCWGLDAPCGAGEAEPPHLRAGGGSRCPGWDRWDLSRKMESAPKEAASEVGTTSLPSMWSQREPRLGSAERGRSPGSPFLLRLSTRA